MRTKAIIIKKQNTNEHDAVFTCYTEKFGKLSAIAKSILKSNSIQAMHLGVFNLADFEVVQGKGIPIIASAHAVNTYPAIRASLSKTAAAYFLAEVVDSMMFDNQADKEMWDYLTGSLGRLADCDDKNILATFRDLQRSLLGVMGYMPSSDPRSPLDAVYSYISGKPFRSLEFLYSVIK